MLLNIAIVLVTLWLLGTAASISLGGFVHVLFWIAGVLFIVHLAKSSKPHKSPPFSHLR